MSMKDKRVKSVVESDDENEQGACAVGNDPRRFSLAVPEPMPGSMLDDSVDNLSMEVQLGGDSSRHPSEISSVSYQNLLDDGEPSNSIISRRGSDDSLDSYPPEFPDAELPPDDLETFEASDLPLSEHFPLGAMVGADSRDKSRGDRSSYVSDNSSNISHPNVRLKDQPSAASLENVRIRDKNTDESNLEIDEDGAKRSGSEIRNNIPIPCEVKDHAKDLNIDLGISQKSSVTGLKQSPGVARRVGIDTQAERPSSSDEIDKQYETAFASALQQPSKLRLKKASSKVKENVIEVITPIPRNINVENEYDYVKYARVQQGNSYVGMRLAYSSSSDSLNIKQGAFSENNSREPSPEKNPPQKIPSDLGNQKVCEESLMEIPLNSSDFPEDKKAFTLSPANTECDSVEVESVTSEDENSTPGFPTLEDGLSSSQTSDVDEVVSGIANGRSPSKSKLKQKATTETDVLKKEEDCRPKEMDAQAIMDDLKMKREALDMAIADIKSAIQRSKSVSLESSYLSQTEAEGTQPVWVKRVSKEATGHVQRRQEEMRRVQQEIERHQQDLAPSLGKSHQEKELADLCDREKFVALEDEKNIAVTRNVTHSAGLQGINAVRQAVADIRLVESVMIPKTELAEEKESREVHPLEDNVIPEVFVMDNPVDAASILLNERTLHNENEPHISNSSELCHFQDGMSAVHEPVFYSYSSPCKGIVDTCDKEIHQSTPENMHIPKLDEGYEIIVGTASDESQHLCSDRKDLLVNSDTNLMFGTGCVEAFTVDNSHLKDSQELLVSYQEVNSTVQGNELFGIDSKHNEQSSLEDSTGFPEMQTQGIHYPITFTDENVPRPECVKYSSDSASICSENSDYSEEGAVKIKRRVECATDTYMLEGSERQYGIPKGYDSDDECQDAEGIRYTRRIKGKKYAPLQNDDALEMRGTSSGVDASKSNGHMFSNNGGSFLGNSGVLVNHEHSQQLQSEKLITEANMSAADDSNTDANGNMYTKPPNADSDTDEETDRLLQKQYQERDKHVEIPELSDPAATSRSETHKRHSKAKEAAIRDPDRPEVLIEGVLFRARYLGSTQLISEGQPSKAMRMMQAQEAVGRIKAPEGENQPSTDVDLFVSTEKIMVLNTDLQEIMMDHSLRTISYIADIGDILVIMARRRLITSPDDLLGRRRRQAKILCHVFESDEAQLIAQSIGQAFQVAYLEFLKANGIEDPGLLKEMDYQDVLNQQEIYGEELNLFANKDYHKEVIVPKSKNESLGVVIVESGWGSMVPTVVLANMLPTGPAARCGQLNIGDQIISINGVSLVGLPLSACQTYIKASRSQTVVKLTVVPCPPVVEVLIKRPDVKYQLGFSVQNGVICSLLRGGIAERGGVRVGHRIIEINNQSVVAVPHEKIVTLLASSVGEIHMKTMPTSIFRLLTGQDVPHYL